jgi:hypothetical protein
MKCYIMFVPSTMRFELNPDTSLYDKRFIYANNLYRVCVPQHKWDRNMNKPIKKWISNGNVLGRTFPYGTIYREDTNLISSIQTNSCELCGKVFKIFRTKRNHMSRCKFDKSKHTSVEEIKNESVTNTTDTTTQSLTKSKEGYIYIVQPEILAGTDRYKIGSSRPILNRLNSAYGKNSLKICIFKVHDQFKVETYILRKIASQYPPIQGREWFECKADVLFDKVIEAYLEYKLTLKPE